MSQCHKCVFCIYCADGTVLCYSDARNAYGDCPNFLTQEQLNPSSNFISQEEFNKDPYFTIGS